jgi:hypothetical protein
MATHSFLALSAAAFAASISGGYAGPCSDEIDRVQARVDAKLEAEAGSGRSAPESREALLHRQPTPGSIAAAKSKVGDLSAATVEAVKAAMAHAREGDRSGDQSACERALAEAQRLIGP